MAVCGFHDFKEANFVTDTLLFIRTIKQKVDCDSDAVTKKEITLTKVDMTGTPFNETVYSVDGRRRFWLASTQLLNDKFLSKLSTDSLDYIRNEIYASKGYLFKTDKWRKTFEREDWYEPNSNKEIVLSVIEQINVNKAISERK